MTRSEKILHFCKQEDKSGEIVVSATLFSAVSGKYINQF